jgi:tetratricopeptide (TPR) repeat protein
MYSDKPISILEGLAPIIGLRIREARTDKGMSQKELVGERFSKSYISSIERGKITPSLKALEYIAKQLNISVAYLLTGVHPGQTPASVVTVAEEEPESPTRWDLMITEAKVLREQRKYESARNLLNTKVRLRQLNVEQLKQYHHTLALIYVDLNDPNHAIPELDSARELAEKTNDQEMLARVRQLMGVIYMLQSKPVLAIEQLRAALQAIENGQLSDFQFQLSVYSNLGILHYQLGDEKEAIVMYREALRIAENAADPEKLSQLYWSLSTSFRESGNLSQAKLYATKSLALYESTANLRALAQLRAGFGVIMKEAKQFDEAETQFQLALKLASTQKNLEGLAYANMNLADLYMERGELTEARDYSDAMEQNLDSVDSTTRGQALASRGSLLSATGDNDGAGNYFEKAVELLEDSGAKELLSKVYFRYAGVLRQNGDAARAAEMYERAYRQLNRNGVALER